MLGFRVTANVVAPSLDITAIGWDKAVGDTGPHVAPTVSLYLCRAEYLCIWHGLCAGEVVTRPRWLSPRRCWANSVTAARPPP